MKKKCKKKMTQQPFGGVVSIVVGFTPLNSIGKASA